jgi:amino acid transporter
VLIALIYLVGTLSVLWVVPTADVNVVSGFLQSIQAVSRAAGASFAWLVPTCALLYTIGNIGGTGAWLIGPARVAFMIGLDRYLPAAFGKIHPRWQTPYVAILIQAGLSTLFLLLSVLGRGTTVERAYLMLLDTMLLIYFIPFIYLFLAYLKVAGAPGQPRRAVKAITGVSGLAVTVFAMVVACIPPNGTPSVLLFELKVMGGRGCSCWWGSGSICAHDGRKIGRWESGGEGEGRRGGGLHL